MFERERQLELDKIKTAGLNGQLLPLPGNRYRQLAARQSPKDFLQRIFPSINPNVLELVYQGCGGNLERAIEQLVTNVSAHSAQILQQSVLSQGYKVAAVPNPPAITGLCPQLSSKSGQSAFSHVLPTVVPLCNVLSPLTTPHNNNNNPPGYPAGMISHIPLPGLTPAHVIGVDTQKQMLTAKSAFQAKIPSSRVSPNCIPHPEQPPSQAIRGSHSPPKSALTNNNNNNNNNRKPIKFSVEAIIGK